MSTTTIHTADCDCDECYIAAFEDAALERVRAHIATALLEAGIATGSSAFGGNSPRFVISLVKEIAAQLDLTPPPDLRALISAELRQEVFQRDGYRCVSCGASTRLTIDHIIPISKGGTNDRANLQTLCRPCNTSKGTR